MSEQPLNLKTSLHILRQHWITVGLIIMLGLLAGAGFVSLNPPLYSDTALVALSTSTRNVATQVLIAGSNPVLARAAQDLGPSESVQLLSRNVQVTNPFFDVLSIRAQGNTAAQAVQTANAVADSYAAYVSAADNPSGKTSARVLQRATSASKTWLIIPILAIGGIGALAGGLVGSVGVLAGYRDSRRLLQRDEIADAVGVPVLASVAVRHPTNAHQWTRLLDEYKPSAADAQRLRNALDYLGLADIMSNYLGTGGSSVTVITLSSDPRALALGPQLAVFAASQGILTALVFDSQHHAGTTAELQAACAATSSSRLSNQLLVDVAQDATAWPTAALTVVAVVVDSRSPHRADTIHTDAAVLGVTAGVVTAEQLARVATSTATGDGGISGILVADPDLADPTTGRLPQLGRRTEMPTRVTVSSPVARR